VAYDGKIRSVTSDADGLVSVTNLYPGVTYQFRRGDETEWEEVTVPSTATSPYAIPNLIGAEE
jgi:hypothetical protein